MCALRGTSSIQILIADDNALNRRIVQDMLKLRGYKPRSVSDGAEAIQALESESFDLVIMDCLMPGMDGYETTRAIRQADPSCMNPEIPILAITALASESDKKKCLTAGMNDYISKPFVAEELFRRVEALLGTHARAGCGHPSEQADNGAGRYTKRNQADEQGNLLGKALRSMSALLTRDLQQWQAELNEFLERDDYEQIQLLAHKIRGTADVIGHAGLSELSAQLERSARLRDETLVPPLVRKVITCLKELPQTVNADG